MLTTKMFRDGERIVITIEGEDADKTESLVRDFFAKLIDDTFFSEIKSSKAEALPKETIPQINTPPVETIKNTPKVEEEKPVVPTLTDGPYIGKTPIEVISAEDPKESLKGFRELVSIRKNSPKPLKTEINKAILQYVRTRFSSVEPEAYANKLNSKQLYNFFDESSFGGCIPEAKKKVFLEAENIPDWKTFMDFIDADVDTARRIAAKTIQMFKG